MIKKELFHFYAQLIPNEMKIKVRYFQTQDWIICNVTNDFNYIIIPPNSFVFNGVDVIKMKLNKIQKLDAIEYNEK